MMSCNSLHLRILKSTNNTNHTGTVIFFHGSGSTAEDCSESIRYLMRRNFDFPHLKVIFPTAPLQPYTPMCGEKSNVWFDRLAISSYVPECTESIEKISTKVKELIETENRLGIPNNRIVVGGISMGGALALYTGLKWETSLAGIFAISSFLNKDSMVYEHLQNGNILTPELLQLHSAMDDLVPLDSAKQTFDKLKALGVKGNFLIEGRGEHFPNASQLSTVHSWIEKILPSL